MILLDKCGEFQAQTGAVPNHLRRMMMPDHLNFIRMFHFTMAMVETEALAPP